MMVYSVLQRVDYEGDSLEGVFATREDALRHIQRMVDFFGVLPGITLGIVESELGAPTQWEQFEAVGQ